MERRVYRYETVGSTNTELMALARQGAAEGTVVLARRRRRGRGPHGPQLPVPGGAGAVRIGAAAEQPGGRPSHSGAGGHGQCAVPSAAAAACPAASSGLTIWCCRAGRSAGFWRRLCRDRRAACGSSWASASTSASGGRISCRSCRETAASLSMIAGAEMDRTALETALLEELESLRQELPQETAERRQEYSAACLNLGRRVRVLRPDGERSALAVSLTPGLRPCGAL